MPHSVWWAQKSVIDWCSFESHNCCDRAFRMPPPTRINRTDAPRHEFERKKKWWKKKKHLAHTIYKESKQVSEQKLEIQMHSMRTNITCHVRNAEAPCIERDVCAVCVVLSHRIMDCMFRSIAHGIEWHTCADERIIKISPRWHGTYLHDALILIMLLFYHPLACYRPHIRQPNMPLTHTYIYIQYSAIISIMTGARRCRSFSVRTRVSVTCGWRCASPYPTKRPKTSSRCTGGERRRQHLEFS